MDQTNINLDKKNPDSSEEEKLKEDIEYVKFLVFKSDGILFGIDISNVIEIIINKNITHVPMTPPYVIGVINLRGQVIPIMDMRRKMNKPDVEYDDDACIIVLDYMSTRIGVFVEGVAYVADVDIETATENSLRNKEKFIKGMINDNGKTILLLDLETLLNIG